MINPVDDTSWVGKEDKLRNLLQAREEGMLTQKEFDRLTSTYWKSVRGGGPASDPFLAIDKRYREYTQLHGLAWNDRGTREHPRNVSRANLVGFRIVRNK